jgi:hypothetical protein
MPTSILAAVPAFEVISLGENEIPVFVVIEILALFEGFRIRH